MRAPPPEGYILSAPSFLATFFPGLLIRRALPFSASSCAFSSCSLYSGEHFLLYVFVIEVFSVFTYIHCTHTRSRTALLVSLGERTGSLLGLISLSISDFSIGNVQSHHIYVFCTSSLAPYLEGPIHLTEHILSGGLSTRIFFCVSLSFLSPWLDQLSFRYQMVYAIYLEIIIPIQYSIFHTLCYM